MSDFALQFVPDGGMTKEERIAAAKAGTLQISPESAARADAADEMALRSMAPDAGVVEHFGSGANRGLAGLAGTPVDLTAALLNLGLSGVNAAFGTSIPPITNPVGGRGTFESLLSPVITESEPNTAAERYAARIGEEVGYGAPMAALAGPFGASFAKLTAANTAADTAAGVAGQTAREVAPESDALDIVATLLAGGGTAAGIARRGRSKPPVPFETTDEMFEAAGKHYDDVEASGAALTAPAQREMFDNLQARLKAERASERLHPRAYAAVEEAKNWPNSRLVDVEETRRVIGRDVAANPDEAAVGMALKDEIGDFLDSLTPAKVVSGDPRGAISDLLAGRHLTHQAHKARAVEGQAYRAKARAARAGRGGNEINTMRQNVGKILDKEVAPLKPGQRSGYTPDEIAQMEKINFGTRGQNFGRHLAGLAPTTGALPALASTGGVGGAVTGMAVTGNPLFGLAAAPAATGLVAKGLTERATRKQIEELLDIIRRGGTKATATTSSTGNAALIAQLLAATDAR